MQATILFQKDKAKICKKYIVEEFICCCEKLDFAKLKRLVDDKTYFSNQGKLEFLTELETNFNKLKFQGINKLITKTSFIDLPFFNEAIVSFTTTEKKGKFSLIYNTDDGYVKDITFYKYID